MSNSGKRGSVLGPTPSPQNALIVPSYNPLTVVEDSDKLYFQGSS